MRTLIKGPIKFIARAFLLTFLLVLLLASGFFLWTKHLLTSSTASVSELVTAEETAGFPIGVDTDAEMIIENPLVDTYVERHLSIDINNSRKERPLDKILAKVSKWDWYQNLASSVSRLIVISPGERREEIVSNIGDILDWTKEERTLFSDYITKTNPLLEDGKFIPGRYVVSIDATPENVADLIYENFAREILAHYSDEVRAEVPLEVALTIASLLQREAYDFTDMRFISGVIWNRLFIDMPLQLDATLQYVRGSDLSEALWWPRVVPNDKFIESPYNTYANVGLPPAPIANPSVEAVVAALNPRVTDCMFYFHDPRGKFYCTETYEEHVQALKEVYGRGS